MATFAEAIGAYKTIARADGKSEKPVEWVCGSAGYRSSFLRDGVALQEIITHDIRRWVAALRDRKRFSGHPDTPVSSKPLSPTSVNNYVRGVKPLFSTLVRREIIADHPVARFKAPKIPKLTMQSLFDSQLKAVFKTLLETGHPLRNRVLVALLWDPCLRISEVVGLQYSGVNLEMRDIKVWGRALKNGWCPYQPGLPGNH